jgi:hypothetical protein
VGCIVAADAIDSPDGKASIAARDGHGRLLGSGHDEFHSSLGVVLVP